MPLPSNYNRRCHNHDYRGRCIYLITILGTRSLPAFSSITPEPEQEKLSPVVKPLPLGMIIGEELSDWERQYPALNILRRVVMPDHVHFVVFVEERIEVPLGALIAVFKKNCTQRLWAMLPELRGRKVPMFEDGFNDKIAFRAGAKDAFYAYVADNPRRYLIKKFYPDYFYHKVMIEVDGKRYGLYGNLCLLDEPVKASVKIKRDKSKMPELPVRIKEWEEVIRCGGVLVSPFINPEEKVYRDMAIAAGAPLILVVNYCFSERKKPYKELFELCGEGRLLIVTNERYERAPDRIPYAEAQEMNELARKIAELAPGAARQVPR